MTAIRNWAVPLLSILFSGALLAQEVNDRNGFGIGFQLNEYQDDFGLGINVNSPYFLYESVTVRLRANYMYNQAVIEGKSDWLGYGNFSLGLASGGTRIGESIRLYGEGGVIALLPPEQISSNSSEWGGYGLFGFEFFFEGNGSYFLEVGGVGTGASADKVQTEPIYSNGLTISVGFRFTP